MPLSGKTIMLVDNDSDILTATKMVLEHYHARVEGFTKSDAALQTFASQPNAYDLVITDVRMPVMNGFEFGNKIHSIRADEPVLYISAFDIDKEMAGAASLDDIVAKPLDIPTFCGKVRHKLMIN